MSNYLKISTLMVIVTIFTTFFSITAICQGKDPAKGNLSTETDRMVPGQFIIDSESDWQKGTFNSTCTDGNGNLILCPVFGDGSDGDLDVPGGVYKVSKNMNYRNVTIHSGATLDTQNYIIRVYDTLLNYGTITDTYGGGDGGAGGKGGKGGYGSYNHPPIPPTPGEPSEPGKPPQPGCPGAGWGGDGGGGGGGGGHAWDTLFLYQNVVAVGGDGGDGGAGGKGGGHVKIYAYHLDDHGIIHADGSPAKNGKPGEDGEYYAYPKPFESRDFTGGGGGGGAGGDGGDGGTVDIRYVNLSSLGTYHANGGASGYGGDGGDAQYNQSFPKRLTQKCEDGAPGQDGGGRGGDAYCGDPNITPTPSEDGKDGKSANGTVIVAPQLYKSYGNYTSVIFDAGERVDWESASVHKTTPSGTSVVVWYCNKLGCFSNINAVPDSRYLWLEIELKTKDTLVTPLVDNVTVCYSPATLGTYYMPTGDIMTKLKWPQPHKAK